METALIGLGSNLGDREVQLRSALDGLRATPGVEVVRVSSLYETDPVGGPPQGKYLNACVLVRTVPGPRELLLRLLAIEAQAGRVRGPRNAPRPLDLDLLLHGDQVVSEPGLDVPHPRFAERAFVLRPACEIAPALVHPRLLMPLADLLAALGPVRGVVLHRRVATWSATGTTHASL